MKHDLKIRRSGGGEGVITPFFFAMVLKLLFKYSVDEQSEQ
ncbi:hypothetical protein TR2A62_1534 [Thalassobium sp. R2A62]|nr:hypothetical protein TR2A62_1534 [Thalassobium sp. R2A62]